MRAVISVNDPPTAVNSLKIQPGRCGDRSPDGVDRHRLSKTVRHPGCTHRDDTTLVKQVMGRKFRTKGITRVFPEA